MSESRWKKLHDLRPLRSEYRVVEHVRDGGVWLSIHQVWFDAEGGPARFEAEPASVGAGNGDALCDVLNDLAMALTKPSLLASDFKAGLVLVQ